VCLCVCVLTVCICVRVCVLTACIYCVLELLRGKLPFEDSSILGLLRVTT